MWFLGMHKHKHAASLALCFTLLKHHSLHFEVFPFCSKNKTIFHAPLALHFQFSAPKAPTAAESRAERIGAWYFSQDWVELQLLVSKNSKIISGKN